MQLRGLADAVVSLGGCTASFVSPQGLVATNHHCAYGAIQLNSTAEKNLIKDGFSAAAFKDELSAGPNARIYVLDDITDVTAQAKAAIAGAGNDPLKRIMLEHGDVVVWGRESRLYYHGIQPLKPGVHPLTGEYRYNLTFRQAGHSKLK